jgi:histidinol phosphatase-like enzyme (inositol monophosphatase family)
MAVPPVDDDLLDFAAEIADEAAQLTLRWFGSSRLRVDHKSDGTEVTDADRQAEALIRDRVAQRHPDDRILGEEAGASGGSGSRQWIIDPIDGTASFVRGVPLYASLLGMFDEHGPAIGIINIPALGESIVAGRGRGAVHDGESAGVSDVRAVADSCISSSSYDRPWWPSDALAAITGSGARTRTWGDGYGYLLVATGRIEAMIDPSLYTYDISPMLTVIPESGGRITRWDGGTELADKAGWVASNGHVHDELLGYVRPS